MPESNRAPTPRNQFSFSRVKAFNQCPKRYRYRYLKGFRELFRSVESFMGSVVHDVLEWLYDERERRSSPELDTVLKVLTDRWNEALTDEVTVIRRSDCIGDYLVTARELVERFHRDTFSRDRSTTVALEMRLSHRLSESVVFTGFADRIGRTEDGRLFVVDYKTSKREGDPSDFSEGLQAPLYAACAMLREGDSEALAGYHYLRHGSTRWQSITVERGTELFARFRELADQVRAARDFEPRPGILCAWCGFNAACPAAEVPEALSGGLDKAREIAEQQPSLMTHTM